MNDSASLTNYAKASTSKKISLKALLDANTRTNEMETVPLDDDYSISLDQAKKDTRKVFVLRAAAMGLLVITAVTVSTGVFIYTSQQEHNNFIDNFEDSAYEIIESFHDAVELTLGAIDTLSVGITSYAIRENLTFPFLTVPDFELLGANTRIQSGASQVCYLPWVTDDRREEWEEFALENRHQVDEAFQREMLLRNQQDSRFGIDTSAPGSGGRRRLSDTSKKQEGAVDETILEDGTGYHTKIWSNGAITPLGNEAPGSGPYLPVWQRNPVNLAKQEWLNWNFATALAIDASLDALQKNKRRAVMNRAVAPLPVMLPGVEGALKLGQYRENTDEYVKDPFTFLAYPVYTSFDEENQEIAAVIAAGLYWKALFSNLLSNKDHGLIIVVTNSFNQTFSYRIDGPTASFLGMIDAHDKQYDYLEMSEDVNFHLQSRARPRSWSYTTIPLNEEVGKYRIQVYASRDTEEIFKTTNPSVYTAVVVCVFAFTSLFFILFTRVVEQRQHLMMRTALANAQRVADTERELNEFLSHEVRNPLAAAMSACGFVSTALNDSQSLSDANSRKECQDDVRVIKSSLHFINDFLRSMLDIHRADGKKLQLNMAPTDLMKDVIEPVATMIHTHESQYEMVVECQPNLVVNTDCLRMKQVVLNLVRNASKFVEQGFIKIRGEVVDGHVVIYVEDSGPGIPASKRENLFDKYQQSLDSLNQGTGIGLCLAKNLVTTMNGDLFLEQAYNSGVEGRPGACFVILLNAPPLDLEKGYLDELNVDGGSSQDPQNDEKSGTDHTSSESLEEGETRAAELELPEGMRVLFVDDDVVLRKLFKRAVTKAEPTCVVHEAGSGEIAIKLCETEQFDLIFMDQYMASVDKQLLGTETTRELRAAGVQSKICGLSANDIEESFVKAGADYFMLKPLPCDKEVLRRLLLDMVGRKKAT